MNSCSNHNTLSIGHRGAKGYVAENTLESISKAIELGVDGIEIDNKLICDNEGALSFKSVPKKLGIIGAGVTIKNDIPDNSIVK